MDVAWNLSALSRYANTAEGREVGGNHSAARAKVANVPQCRQTFVLQHRIVAAPHYCSTALLHLSQGIAASQWICRAPARDT